jgi:hypothetical protein
MLIFGLVLAIPSGRAAARGKSVGANKVPDSGTEPVGAEMLRDALSDATIRKPRAMPPDYEQPIYAP